MPNQAQARAATQPYRWLAEYYDDFFGAYRAPIDAAREKLLANVFPQVHSACDLACGTGTTAASLANRGIEVFAIDLSPAMCELAQRKATRARLPIHVLRDDMRSFRLPQRVDLVTCESDALNHLPRREDLNRVTRSVARALNPGGHFFFDVNNLKGFRRYWTGTVCIEKPGVFVVMRNSHDVRGRTATSEIDWFLDQDQLWSRHREYVEEVCWTITEIRESLYSAGFGQVRRIDAAPFYAKSPLITSGCRSFYLARKS